MYFTLGAFPFANVTLSKLRAPLKRLDDCPLHLMIPRLLFAITGKHMFAITVNQTFTAAGLTVRDPSCA